MVRSNVHVALHDADRIVPENGGERGKVDALLLASPIERRTKVDEELGALEHTAILGNLGSHLDTPDDDAIFAVEVVDAASRPKGERRSVFRRVRQWGFRVIVKNIFKPAGMVDRSDYLVY